jgi:sulfide:quinone oxidoreductase
MSIRTIDSNFHVTGQITPNQVTDVAKLGYKTVICMRPDDESFNQPVFADVARAARETGIESYHLPIVPGKITDAQVAELRTVLAEKPSPVLAYCASGNRCAAAYEIVKRGRS